MAELLRRLKDLEQEEFYNKMRDTYDYERAEYLSKAIARVKAEIEQLKNSK